MLVNWIKNSEQCGHPVDHAQLREFVTLLIKSSGGDSACGHNWVGRFLQRRSDIRSKVGKKIDHLRVKNTNPDLLKPWFESLHAVFERSGITPSNMWNVDETGIALGVCVNQRVIGTSETNKTYMKTPEDREWVSTIECISAVGNKINPVVIFKGQTLQSTWFTPGKTPDYFYTCSEKGWTSNDIGIRWLKDAFLPTTDPGNGIPRLLLLDGHGSHVSVEFMKIAWENNVYLFYLIPHSSHVLQPLDLSCFSVLKSRYRRQIALLASLSDSTPIKKAQFLEFYHKARTEGLTEPNIRAGWKTAGIYPWNPQKVLRSSQVKSTAPKPTLTMSQQHPIQQQRSLISTMIATPRNRHDLQIQLQQIAAQEPVSRSLRTLLQKASKTIDTCTFTITQQTRLIASYHSQRDHLQNKRRKKVVIDANTRFACIEDIVKVQEEIAARQKEYDRKDRAKLAREMADEVVQRGISRLLHVFHVVSDVNSPTEAATL
jgi:DDE superfamily endonuclease